MKTDMSHLNHLQAVAVQDVIEIKLKENTYQGSWKRRGGIGAAMMVLRKVDRLEVMLKEGNYDIFNMIKQDLSGNDGTVLAEVRDLRRYLLLIEAEIRATTNSIFPIEDEHLAPGTPADGGHHERQYLTTPSGKLGVEVPAITMKDGTEIYEGADRTGRPHGFD